MENRIYFRLGAKFYNLTEFKSEFGIWYEWVESARLYTRKMTLSRGALVWLCRRLKEASDIKGKSWNRKSVVVLPESRFNEAWEGLIKKIENFMNKPLEKQISITTDKDDYNRGERGDRSYKDDRHKNKWAVLEHPTKTNSAASEGSGDKDPLRRCLVGSFPGCYKIPNCNDVRNWAQKTWKDSESSSGMKMKAPDGGRLSSDIFALHAHPADHQDKITSSSREKLAGAVSSKIQGASPSANSHGRPSSSALSTSDGTGAASTSADNGLSRTSSVNSFSSEKSTLNPHAKEFKLNPNAKSFVPSQSPLRPASPVYDNSFYYPAGVATVPNMHGMPVGVGPSFSAHQPVIFNPPATPVPQQFFHPNGPQYGQQMMIGHPRQVVYMPSYPGEMPFKGREY